MQTVGDTTLFTCVSLICGHQRGLFCGVASEITVVSSLDT